MRVAAATLVVATAAFLVGDVATGGDAPRTRSAGAAPTNRPERLRFRATWNAIPVANAELLIQPAADGRSVALRGRAETNEALDLLWRMRDTFEATVALRPVAPRRLVLRQNENDRHRDTTIVADGRRLVATVERRHRRTRRGTVPLTPTRHDTASVAYAIRAMPANATATTYEVLAGTKLYTLRIAPAGQETIDVAGRSWPARRYHLELSLTPTDVESGAPDDVPPTPAARRAPEMTRAAAVEDEDERAEPWREMKTQEAELWVSAGPERLPLRMTSRTFWGWVTVELTARGGADAR
jgi:hypothetical protein